MRGLLITADRFGVKAVKEIIGLSGRVGARIALEVKRHGRCPTAAELASPNWLALRSPAALGDAVQATLENGVLQIRPPTWAKPPPTKRPHDPTFSIPCP